MRLWDLRKLKSIQSLDLGDAVNVRAWVSSVPSFLYVFYILKQPEVPWLLCVV